MNTAEFKEILEAQKNDILSQLENYNANDPFMVEREVEGDRDMDSLGDDAQETYQHQNIEAVENLLKKQLKEVEAALERIENGTFGIDENTGEPIVPERLKANPTARFNI